MRIECGLSSSLAMKLLLQRSRLFKTVMSRDQAAATFDPNGCLVHSYLV